MIRLSCAVVVLPALLSTAAKAQSPQWRQHATAFATGISGTALAYDHRRDRVVLFGGVNGHVPHNFTAELDGDVWSGVISATPPPPLRWGHQMAYDSRRGEVILCGGGTFGPIIYTDTWAWDGTGWQQRYPQTAPPPSFEYTLTYDEARGVCVLYGGSTTSEWDGTNWLPRTPATVPPPRNYHGAAYDSRRGRVVVYGGGTTSPLVDTWEWDGVNWQQGATTGLQPFALYPAMAYDRERARCVMFGYGGGFEYDGSTWSPAPTPPGSTSALAYDRQRGRVVRFCDEPSSTPYAGTTWSYELPGLAVAQPFGSGCGNPRLVMREDPLSRPLVGTTLGVDIDHAPTGTAFMCFGWSNRQVLGYSLPLPMDVFQLHGCWLLQSDDAITLPCTTTGATTARFSFAIPQNQAFVGVRFFLQPWAPAPGLNPANAAIGDGLAVTIGSL